MIAVVNTNSFIVVLILAVVVVVIAQEHIQVLCYKNSDYSFPLQQYLQPYQISYAYPQTPFYIFFSFPRKDPINWPDKIQLSDQILALL